MKARSLCVAVFAFGAAVLGGVVGCGGASDAVFSSDVSPGSERGPCRAGGTCDAGLECRSDLCVSDDEGGGAGGKSNASGGTTTSTAGSSSSTGGGDGSGGGNPSGGDEAGGASPSGGGTASGGTGMSEGGASLGGADGTAGAGGAAIECSGAHPIVADKTRYCATDSCYCSDPFDTCFPEATAAACCATTPRCGDEPKDRGVNCAGAHPVIGPPRTCEPGNCFCSDGDAKKYDVCLPKAVADSCCPPGVSLTCVD